MAPLWLRLAVVTTGTRRSVPQDSQQVSPYCDSLKNLNLGTEAEDAGYDSLASPSLRRGPRFFHDSPDPCHVT